ncbi:MAG: LacI family DNA-binding transcriptional regulator [Pseudomonadota bacterium]
MTRKRNARANSTDVARLAGVSIAAVSRAFAPGSSISPELAERVHKAARQLHYVPNSLARSLITRQSNIVALMLPNMSNPIYSSILAEASRGLEGIGKQILLFTPPGVEDFDKSLQQMLEYQVDAIVIAAASISSRMATLCLDRDVPVVTMGRYLPGLPVHSVRPDDREGGALAADLLLRGGGRRFAIITGPSSLTTMIERREAIFGRLAGAIDGAQVKVHDGHLTYAGGYQAALEIMAGPDRPDSLICLTDIMAIGAMDAIRHELKLRIPEDVAVIGFDDIAEAGHASYRLSTIRTPVREMIDHMIELISPTRARSEPVAIKIPARMIVRDSTRAIGNIPAV